MENILDLASIIAVKEITLNIDAVYFALLFIAAAAAVGRIVIQILQRIRHPEDIQNIRIDDISEGQRRINSKLDRLDESYEKRFVRIEQMLDNDNKRIIAQSKSNNLTLQVDLELVKFLRKQGDDSRLENIESSLEKYLLERKFE